MKIAIVRLSALGDIIHSALVLQFIKKRYKNAHITWFCDKKFCEILQYSPFLDQIVPIEMDFIKEKKIGSFFRVIKALKNLEPFDLILDMQGLIKSALITHFLKGTKVGFDFGSAREGLASFFYHKKVYIPYNEHIFLRNMQLVATGVNFSFLEQEIVEKLPFLGYSNEALKKYEKIFNGYKKVILLILGASKPQKRYPKEKFLEVANLLDGDIFLVYKEKNDQNDAEYISKNAKNIRGLLNLNLDELKAAISRAKLVIGGDSGPTYIAWALNIPSITIFGNTPSFRFCPNTKINRCIGGENIKNSKGFDKNDFSIKEIRAQDIVKMAKELLG